MTTGGGARWQLGPLTEWEILRTDGHSCDSFSVRLPVEEGDCAQLMQAAAFMAEEGGRTVFSGIVDEVRLDLDTGGRTAVLEGRSLLGRLLDNEATAVEFQTAGLEEMLGRFVRPFGLTRVRAPQMPAVARFRVDGGTSCWAAFWGWCLHSAGLTPRQLADGTLTLLPCEERWSLGPGVPVTRAAWQRTRYGVASEVLLSGGGSVQNAAFRAQGGMARKVAPKQVGYLRPNYRTPAQRLRASAECYDTLTVTMPGAFAVEPGARVEVGLPALGASGSFTAREVLSRSGEGGATCTLTLVRGV